MGVVAKYGVSESAVTRARGLIACVYRASQWRHKAVELAAYDLLQYVDDAAGIAG